MFEISDLPQFFLAFFLVFPAIVIIHEAGHVFFAWIMGGKNIKISVGTGKPKFSLGMLEIRKYYFWYGFCTYENITRKDRFSNILIFSGGALFNTLAAFAVVILVENEVLEPGMFTYQFTYFSLYYIFFALLPMPYPDGNYSDGKIILDLLKNNQTAIRENIFKVQWNKEKESWELLDHNCQLIDDFKEENEALKMGRERAQMHRPSCVIIYKNGEEREVQNYPKVPL